MRSKNSTTVGALHPILFFAGVYVVVLFFSIFICSTIFYSCNASKADMAKTEQKDPVKESKPSATTSLAAVQ